AGRGDVAADEVGIASRRVVAVEASYDRPRTPLAGRSGCAVFARTDLVTDQEVAVAEGCARLDERARERAGLLPEREAVTDEHPDVGRLALEVLRPVRADVRLGDGGRSGRHPCPRAA